MSTTMTERVRRILTEHSSKDQPLSTSEIVDRLNAFPASTVRSGIRRLYRQENYGQIKHKKSKVPGTKMSQSLYWFQPRDMHLRDVARAAHAAGVAVEIKTAQPFHLRPDKGEPWESIPMILFCPSGHRHIDEGDFAEHPHHTHACQTCGHVWRPAKVNTHGVQFLPGYRNGEN